MRISTIDGDSDYKSWAMLCSVTLNGEPFDGYTHADEERGKVFMFAHDSDDLVALKGDVVISFPEDAAEEFEDFYLEYLELREE